jgi:two-component system, chemotaxis family, chemotaxis protein CheY
MKVLIVEDDFISRKLMQKFLERYGEADMAVNGQEALLAFRMAWQEGAPYDLICLDIMLPELNGQEVLRAIRAAEAKKGLERVRQAKVLMTTALRDARNVYEAIREKADGYLVKPIDKNRLMAEIRSLGLIAIPGELEEERKER